MSDPSVPGPPTLSDDDVFWFNEGTHRRLGLKMGGRMLGPGAAGATFALWAPNARAVEVIGDFNGWRHGSHRLVPRASSGIWEGVAGDAARGDVYKFLITTADGARLEKADPYALRAEVPPRTGSVLWDVDYRWTDDEWMRTRADRARLDRPISVYELHLGSWYRDPAHPGRLLTYTEVAPRLVDHLVRTGFTHVELLPVMEHPFYGSWGYQVTGFFAPSSRYGTPQDLMALIDQLHRAGIGVILDWVPSHFPDDAFGLARFDGTHLYEHADPRLGVHPDWGSLIFNYGRHEVRSFLASSAEHWLSAFHADGLRVDAVASMLYLDYSRPPGAWLPNPFGGNENVEAIGFLRQLNTGIYADHPDVQVIAEESTAWPGVTRPADGGGLGFGLKWDMGWMHDTLAYLERDPVHRRYAHDQLTFRAVYASSEHYVLPLSHDEVVHGKRSLVAKMPGDDWQQLANLRLLLGYQYGLPGKKLLFMGAELAQRREWDHGTGLDWPLLEQPAHRGVLGLVSDLNRLYRARAPLHELDDDPAGFEWVQPDASDISVLSFLRRSRTGAPLLVVCNFTPVPRHNHLVGVPEGGRWLELLNSDAAEYGGSGMGNLGAVDAQPVPWRDQPRTLTLTLPPLACLYLAPA
ncbi:MAG TPA: 1,4-alpha-glucan branching protein GlgB [Acidimicrobiales bacterium]